MNRRTLLVGALALFTLQGSAWAQVPTEDQEEQMDASFRKFGYVTGQAFACHTKEQQKNLESTAFTVGTNILRLFGSDRAFFFAAAFGAGASQPVDATKCPALIKQAEEMVGRLKVLSSR